MTTLHLSKQNFKFSAAHFLIFDDKHAERLHGHNYNVKVDIVVPKNKDWVEQGFFIDFNVFKKHIKAQLDLWDEYILLPALHKDIKTKINGDSLELRFRERFYVFPKNEVILLPVTNTSVEQFSKLLAKDFYIHFKSYGVAKLRVTVEETAGQGASYIIED
ncbi:MAG: 6-pyruvoyl trahydropterin synthase family protein [Pseudobdellovibrionaceae bacterium]